MSRIGDAALDDLVDPRHDVAVVAAAPVGNVAAHELLAVVAAAARIRIEHGPALAGPELPAVVDADLEAVGVRAGRAAVDVHQQGYRFPGS